MEMTVVEVLEGAHKLALVTWQNDGAGCEPGQNCLAQCIVIAAGQSPHNWNLPKGVALETMRLLAELIEGTRYADLPWFGGGKHMHKTPISEVWSFSDWRRTTLGAVSDLLLDAIEIAKVEARS